MIQQEPLLRAEGQSARINECWLSEGQASYLEKPKDRLAHLVEERNALYEKSGSAGSGFLSRGNPTDRLGSHKRSTGACKARLRH